MIDFRKEIWYKIIRIKSGDPLPSNENYFKRRNYKVKAT